MIGGDTRQRHASSPAGYLSGTEGPKTRPNIRLQRWWGEPRLTVLQGFHRRKESQQGSLPQFSADCPPASPAPKRRPTRTDSSVRLMTTPHVHLIHTMSPSAPPSSSPQ